MSIEVTSVSEEPRRSVYIYRLACSCKTFDKLEYRQILPRFFLGFFIVTLIVAGAALIHSYKYYARLIDVRLARGYLTSRPGLYAAPRLLQVGQKIGSEKLINTLRRAGYVESTSSDVWNGTFSQQGSAIEIRPRRSEKLQPEVVRVGFSGNELTELTGDGIPMKSFMLEPEALANDLTSKAGKREMLAFNEIPPMMVNAILAIEDRRFFEHSGVDLSGLARALSRNVSDERMGQGGSTITQQLVKNTYLTPERTLQRKYAEAMLSIALERRLSKQDVFALYCNEVYLGQRGAVAIRGINEAAQILFNKKLIELTVGETAMIAGLIQGPARYSPLRHIDAATVRRDLVLEAMRREQFITAVQEKSAVQETISIAPESTRDNSLAPYFVDYVNRIAEAEFDASGFSQRIYTTIDLGLQQAAEEALKKQMQRLDATYNTSSVKPQAALVALEPHSGNILAMVGGRNYAESQLNRVTDARRQPGSTFKPFVYAAAIEDGMSPVQTFMDAPREFIYDRNKTYRPANYGGGYSMSEVTLRTGLVKSLNVVTVDVALRTGLARIANLATRFGLPKPERYPALALGTEEVTPLQLAAAYSVFANLGQRVNPIAVLSVDESPPTHPPSDDEQVVSPTTAYMITNMLSAVVERGTARKARGAVKGTAIAGKTGTSRDGWFVGYSPNLVCAVWIGFDDNQQLGLTGADAALPVWVDFMNAAVADRPDLGGTNFECPEGIKFVEIDSGTGLLATLSCPLRELIAVTDRTAPNLECYLHGNVPFPTSPFVDEAEAAEAITVAQHFKAKPEAIPQERKNYRSTRVDVDAQGRRALVNEMR